jgi:butyrate kinase
VVHRCEDELQALAEGDFCALDGEEQAKRLAVQLLATKWAA